MIRSTVNESIITGVREIKGEGIELVLAGINEASAVPTEVKDIDARAAFQTTTPSNAHTNENRI